MQVDSNPSPSIKIAEKQLNGSVLYTKPPLNRYLPAGNNSVELEQAAIRKLRGESISARTSSFKFIGIRKDVTAGIYINEVMPLKGNFSGDFSEINTVPEEDGLLPVMQAYSIMSNIKEVKYDFAKNHDTTVSFRSQITNNV